VTQFGYRPEEFLAGAISFAAIVHPDDLERVNAEVQEYSSQWIDQFRQEYRILSKEGKVRWIDDHTVIERDAAGIITHYQGIIIDITERKRAEDELQLTQLCVDKASIGVLRVTTDGKIVFANEYTSRSLGYSREELCTMSVFDIDPAFILSEWAEHRQKVYTAGSGTFESIHRRKDGSTFPVEVTVNHFDFKGKGVTFSFSKDISVRKRTEEALRVSEEKFRVLAETSPAGIALYQGENLIYTNPAVESMLGYTNEELAQMKFWDWVHEDSREMVRKRGLARMRGEAVPSQYECKFVTKYGEARWAIVSVGLIEFKGKPAGIVTLIDVTDAKQAEEQVRSSLAEKEILLKEIHHRVKNNLQIISTLLELQSDYITDDNSLKFFRESQDRIQSMALVHEKLYQTEDFSLIDFQGYIESLTNHLYRSYVTFPEHISLSVEAGNVTLGIDEAIPCGLIINELVSNSLKYAFPEGRHGKITISFQPEDPDRVVLTVSDTGIGLPDGLDFTHTETLGLQLVNMLVKQLKGVITVRNDHGATFVIKLKRNHFAFTEKA
jgi:PAS domain S-box-containing protein